MKTDLLLRDTSSNALLSIDNEVLVAYKTRKQRMQKMKELENDVNNIKHELVEIKTLLQQILNKV